MTFCLLHFWFCAGYWTIRTSYCFTTIKWSLFLYITYNFHIDLELMLASVNITQNPWLCSNCLLESIVIVMVKLIKVILCRSFSVLPVEHCHSLNRALKSSLFLAGFWSCGRELRRQHVEFFVCLLVSDHTENWFFAMTKCMSQRHYCL